MAKTGPQVTADRVVVGIILITVLVSGPFGVSLVDSENEQLGDGTASVSVIEPQSDEIRVTDGRFGTDISYVRFPDLVVDVESYRGTPRVQYTLAVPGLGIERTTTKLVTAEGRLRLSVDDQALPEPPNRSYSGHLRVRVQSFSTETTVVNRSLEVVVE